MARRELLTDAERAILFGVPDDHQTMVALYTLSRADLELVHAHRGAGNRLGFAVQLALLQHPGFGFAAGGAPEPLVAFMAAQIGVPASAFEGYGERAQTVSDHAREAMTTLGLRPSAESDVAPMVESASRAAWSTDHGVPIARGIVEGLRTGGVMLPTLGRLERVGVAGRARARKQAYDALLANASPAQLSRLDDLLTVDATTQRTPLAWVREITTSPKAESIRGLLERLRYVREAGFGVEASTRVHHDRFRQLVREGRVSSAQLLGTYTAPRRRAILVALLIDLEARLTDAALEMADRMIGGSFTRGGNAKKRVFAATTRDVGRLMVMFDRVIVALSSAQDGEIDGFTAVDQAVGWDKLLRARPQVVAIAELAEEDPLVRAADRWVTLRKFAPALLDAIDFKAGSGSATTLAAVETLRELNRTGRRDVPANAPMPFKKEWRKLVTEGGKPDRRLWETATMAHLRNKLRSGDIWVERSANYQRFDSYLLPQSEVAPIAAGLELPTTANEWLDTRARELDWRLRGFAHRLARGKLDGVAFKNGKLSITPVRADEPNGVDAFGARIDGLMPRVRITELLHEVASETGFTQAFTNLRTNEQHDNPNALLAAILADSSNLGISRMAEASEGVTPDQLTWT